MGDPYEGHPPIPHLEENINELRARRDRVNEELSVEGVDGPLPPVKPGDVLAPFEHFRKSVFINCWHESVHESVAMWKVFLSSGDGIALKTSFETVLSEVKAPDGVKIGGGRMNYADYEGSDFPHGNILRAHTMKQQEYSYEQEIRFSAYSPPPTEKEKYEPGDDVNVQYNKQDEGICIDMNLEDFIEEIRISPYSPAWVNKEYWQSLLEKYDLDINVSESVVTDPPEERIQP